ncbi:MAG TPA: YecA family protein [Caldimonas sp.]|nr:YecA family protein [Caldimonas sp.]
MSERSRPASKGRPAATRPRPSIAAGKTATEKTAALTDAEILELQDRLDALPAPLEPLDVCAIDGFLCGILVQPRPVPRERWLARVIDAEGRAPSPGADVSRIRELVGRREAQLQRAISARHWFDPWIFAPDDDLDEGGDVDEGARTAVLGWVAGFAAALEAFPGLLDRSGPHLNEPLALLYRHFDPDDLDDADDLLAEIEAIEPVADLADAVEGLVRATLLLADEAEAIGREG